MELSKETNDILKKFFLLILNHNLKLISKNLKNCYIKIVFLIFKY